MYYSKDCKCNSLVTEDKLLMITIVQYEGPYVAWKGQVRFLMFMDQPNTINIEKSEIRVLLKFVFKHTSFSRWDSKYHWKSLMWIEKTHFVL